MMISGLGRGEGPDVHSALERLAGQISLRPLTLAQGWNGCHLAMTIGGLGMGPAASKARQRLAQVIGERDLAAEPAWSEQELGQVIRGLGRGEGPEIPAALERLAAQVGRRVLISPRAWPARDLATAASGLGRGRGPVVHETLARLVAVVASRPLTQERGWTAEPLAMMLQGIGQTLYDCALFPALVAALVGRAAQEPGVLASFLGDLCCFSINGSHLDMAWRLLAALQQAPERPGDRQLCDRLLWSTTLLHFACQACWPCDPALPAFFARSYDYWLSCAARTDPEGTGAVAGDRWRRLWAEGYWASQTSGHRPLPVAQAPGRAQGAALPQALFARLRDDLAGHDLQEEVRINDFPVDMVIDGCVCVEVDRPWHCVEVPVFCGPDARDFIDERRTRERFVDHMLRHYGFQVFRVGAVQDDLAVFDHLVEQIRAQVTTPAQPAAVGSGADSLVRSQESGSDSPVLARGNGSGRP